MSTNAAQPGIIMIPVVKNDVETARSSVLECQIKISIGQHHRIVVFVIVMNYGLPETMFIVRTTLPL